MKKIFTLFSVFFFLLTMNSCTNNKDTDIIGEWECTHFKESGWWYYYNEDGTKSDTYYDNEEYSVSPDHPEWYMIRFTNMFMTITDGGAEVDDFIKNVPLPYSFKGDQLRSTLFTSSYDHTDFVTVTFPNDNTMKWYINDSGNIEDSDYGGYEDYKFWITFRRLK